MLGQNLKQLYESQGAAGCVGLLNEGLQSGEFKPEDFSLRELAESFCGHEWVRRLNPRNVSRFSVMDVTEAGEGVDVSAFSNITGQIFYNKILTGWNQATLIGDKLADTVPTDLDGEKMPWLSHVVGEGEDIQPGQVYPETSFGERYIETPATTKQGQICSVTKEMIFFDRTGQALRAAGEVGMRLGYNKERQIIQGAMGVTNSYKLNGTSYNTYLATDPPVLPTWLNKLSGTPLTDYTALNQAFKMSQKVLDPDTGEPLVDMGNFKDLFVMPAKWIDARRIVGADRFATTYPGYQATVTAPGNVKMEGGRGDAIPWNLNVITSPIAYQQLILPAGGSLTAAQANEYWFIGDFKRAFAWMQNWPLTVVQAPANHIKDFEQDIVIRWKSSHRGKFAVLEPRCVFNLYST